jgi:hypothetical protein
MMTSIHRGVRGLRGAAFGMALAGLIGCGDDDDDERDASEPRARDAATEGKRDAATDASAEPDRRCEGAAPMRAGELQRLASGSSLYGQVVDGEAKLHAADGMAHCGLAGVKVCMAESGPCTESDRAGQFVLNGLPADGAARITFEAPGLRSVQRLVVLSSSPIDLFEMLLWTEARTTRRLQRVGREIDANAAAIVALGFGAGSTPSGVLLASDVAITLEPDGIQPLYSIGEFGDSGLSSDELDVSLTATRELGWGLFVGLEPGEHRVRFERGGVRCGPFIAGYGHGFDEQGDLEAVATDGFTTLVGAFCP